jgi:hypothetical protein
MIRVRFPNGQTVQYNDANYVEWKTHNAKLSIKGGRSIAFVPYTSGAIIEFERPCSVSNPLQPLTNRENLEAFIAGIEKCEHTALLAQLKSKLTRFSRKTYRWK